MEIAIRLSTIFLRSNGRLTWTYGACQSSCLVLMQRERRVFHRTNIVKKKIVRIAVLHLVVPRLASGAALFGLNRLDADLDRNGTEFLVGLGSQ